jgi:hypothetical protein
MSTVTKEDIAKLPACDVSLAGIEWRHDMALVLSLVLPDKRRAHLTAKFARHLRVSLEFDERSGGYPLSWDTTYSELPDGEWHVLMDFAHAGAVEFDCSELHFEYDTNAA